jgi:hypothetical protein
MEQGVTAQAAMIHAARGTRRAFQPHQNRHLPNHRGKRAYNLSVNSTDLIAVPMSTPVRVRSTTRLSHTVLSRPVLLNFRHVLSDTSKPVPGWDRRLPLPGSWRTPAEAIIDVSFTPVAQDTMAQQRSREQSDRRSPDHEHETSGDRNPPVGFSASREHRPAPAGDAIHAVCSLVSSTRNPSWEIWT